MSQKNFQIFRSQISDLKTDNVDYLKKPPWKKFFFDIFVIHLSSRYEKRCRMLQRLFSLFQGSKKQLWLELRVYFFIRKKLHGQLYVVKPLYSDISSFMYKTLIFLNCSITLYKNYFCLSDPKSVILNKVRTLINK